MKFNKFIEEKMKDVLENDFVYKKFSILRNRYLENCTQSIAKACSYYKLLSGKEIPVSLLGINNDWVDAFMKFAKSELSKNLKERTKLSDMQDKTFYKLQPNKLIKLSEKLDAESDLIIGIINEVNKFDDNLYLLYNVEDKLNQIRVKAPIEALKENKDDLVVCETIVEISKLIEMGNESEIYNLYDIKENTYSSIAIDFICKEVREMLGNEKSREKINKYKEKLSQERETEEFDNALN